MWNVFSNFYSASVKLLIGVRYLDLETRARIYTSASTFSKFCAITLQMAKNIQCYFDIAPVALTPREALTTAVERYR